MKDKLGIKVYHGFGHKHEMVLFGHVFAKKHNFPSQYSSSKFRNMIRLLRLFFVKPVPDVQLELIWEEQTILSKSEFDGFFRFDWKSRAETNAGWHTVVVKRADGKPASKGSGEGKLFVPHITQYAFISDIDDTIMISHSASIWKRLRVLLFKNSSTREVFPGVAKHYSLLARSHTEVESPNPFFYVSSSEWNLYDYLRDVFRHRDLPDGAFLLNQVKRWYELWKTGKTKHTGKMLRIIRILEVFPNQRFVLFGDSSQSDPAIYAKLAEKYGQRLFAVYIRDVGSSNREPTRVYLSQLEDKGIHTCLFEHSEEAIDHSRKIGLIPEGLN